jgi:carbon monoxide dehydrogenase subunit G
MNFSGTERFDCDQAELWERLTDMAFVARAIPDVERVERIEPAGFACRVRPRFSFLTGSLDLVFEAIEPVPLERLKVRSRGKGIGAAVVVEAELQLAARESGTELRWTGTIVAREGLLKPVSPGLIQGAAQRVINSFWQRFREAVTAYDGKPIAGD